jgi:hypothetical protein
MFRYVPDGHVLGQVQDVPLEGFGVAASFVGKVHRHLAKRAAVGTSYAGHSQQDLNTSGANGKAAKPTELNSPPHDPSRATDRTAKTTPLLTDGENHPPGLILGFDILVAANSKPMVQ